MICLLEGRYPFVVARTGSCARPVALHPASAMASLGWSLQLAASHCWAQALPDVISANPSLRVWTPTPAAPAVHAPVASRRTLAFPALGPGRRFASPRQLLLSRLIFGAAVIY